MNTTIFFDMDGTIANLYGTDNWLEKLQNENTEPYKNAKPLLNLSHFAKLLNKLQKKGYSIGIISWLAKNSTSEYDIAVSKVKKDWLTKHLKSINWNEINIIPYGQKKHTFAHTENDILFDDELYNRTTWTGKAYNETDIIRVLKTL